MNNGGPNKNETKSKHTVPRYLGEASLRLGDIRLV